MSDLNYAYPYSSQKGTGCIRRLSMPDKCSLIRPTLMSACIGQLICCRFNARTAADVKLFNSICSDCGSSYKPVQLTKLRVSVPANFWQGLGEEVCCPLGSKFLDAVLVIYKCMMLVREMHMNHCKCGYGI